jgi:hypothetical protein
MVLPQPVMLRPRSPVHHDANRAMPSALGSPVWLADFYYAGGPVGGALLSADSVRPVKLTQSRFGTNHGNPR